MYRFKCCTPSACCRKSLEPSLTCLSMSQMPLLSSSLRLMGMDGRKWPSRPVVQSAGISQIRKKPSTWSIRYAWKYLRQCRCALIATNVQN